MNKSIDETASELGFSTDELSRLHSGREILYNFFFRSFINIPDEDFFSILYEVLPYIDDEEAAEALQTVKDTQDKLEGEALAEFYLEMKRNYTQIFCLTTSVRTCESHYLSEDRLSRQKPQEDCLELYSAHKIPKKTKYKEDEDFIAMEMWFMAVMASRTAKAAGDHDNAAYREALRVQLDFLQNHLLLWVDKFAANVFTYPAAETLYGPLVRYMLLFLQNDREFLQ